MTSSNEDQLRYSSEIGMQSRTTSVRLRSGLSLLEVIIATTILAVSATLLLKIIETADRSAERADNKNTAQILCQNKLDEILSGISPLEASDPKPILENPYWYYSVTVEEMDVKPLSLLTIEVFSTPQSNNQAVDETPVTVSRDELKPVYSLRRIVRLRKAGLDGDTPFAGSSFSNGDFE